MARSTYIYVIQGLCGGEILGTFTVKYEAIRQTVYYVASANHSLPTIMNTLRDFAFLRLKDGDFDIPQIIPWTEKDIIEARRNLGWN